MPGCRKRRLLEVGKGLSSVSQPAGRLQVQGKVLGFLGTSGA